MRYDFLSDQRKLNECTMLFKNELLSQKDVALKNTLLQKMKPEHEKKSSTLPHDQQSHGCQKKCKQEQKA